MDSVTVDFNTNDRAGDTEASDITAETIADTARFVHGLRWRWQTAERFASRDPADLTYRFDKVIEAAMEWIRSSGIGVTANTKTANAVACAVAIDKDPAQRFAIQARLLSRQAFDKVASRCRVSVNVVIAYEQLFFDVSNYLSARSWILIHLDPVMDDGHSNLTSYALKAAYLGGEHVCEAWLEHFSHLSVDETHDLRTEQGRLRERMECGFLASCLPPIMQLKQVHVAYTSTAITRVPNSRLPDLVKRSIDQAVFDSLADCLRVPTSDDDDPPSQVFAESDERTVRIEDVA